MSVSTPDARLGQAIQSERSGKMSRASRPSCARSARRSVTKSTTTCAEAGWSPNVAPVGERGDQLGRVAGVADDTDDLALPDAELPW